MPSLLDHLAQTNPAFIKTKQQSHNSDWLALKRRLWSDNISDNLNYLHRVAGFRCSILQLDGAYRRQPEDHLVGGR